MAWDIGFDLCTFAVCLPRSAWSQDRFLFHCPLAHSHLTTRFFWRKNFLIVVSDNNWFHWFLHQSFQKEGELSSPYHLMLGKGFMRSAECFLCRTCDWKEMGEEKKKTFRHVEQAVLSKRHCLDYKIWALLTEITHAIVRLMSSMVPLFWPVTGTKHQQTTQTNTSFLETLLYK